MRLTTIEEHVARNLCVRATVHPGSVVRANGDGWATLRADLRWYWWRLRIPRWLGRLIYLRLAPKGRPR